MVTGGLYFGWRSHEIFDADMRLNAQAFWRVLVFALNAILFILARPAVPGHPAQRSATSFSVGEIVGYGLLVSGVVIVVRIAWQFLPGSLGRRAPRARDIGAGEDWRERLLIGWSGMRGAVSLAAALALPLELDSGAAFGDARPDHLPDGRGDPVHPRGPGADPAAAGPVARASASAEPWAPDEAVARLAAAQAALDRLDELESSGTRSRRRALERLRELYRARFARCVAVPLGRRAREIPIENPLRATGALREELIGAERRALLGMRNDGRIKEDVFRRIQRDLDLDEARLRRP